MEKKNDQEDQGPDFQDCPKRGHSMLAETDFRLRLAHDGVGLSLSRTHALLLDCFAESVGHRLIPDTAAG